jgi:hypothetical protein
MGLHGVNGLPLIEDKEKRETTQQLTFKSLAVSLRTTTFNIQNFYMVLALR